MKQQLRIVVDGNCASGKNSLMKLIQKKLNTLNIDCEVALEPVQTWNMEQLLENAARYPSVYMFQLQTLILCTLFQRQREPNKSRVTIFERSLETACEVFTKLHAQEKNLSEVEGRILHGLYLIFQKIKKTPKPDLHFYLRCPPEECYRRVQTRNQSGDSALTLDYIQKLDTQYEKYFSECLIKNKNLIVFDSSSCDAEKLADEATRRICFRLNM